MREGARVSQGRISARHSHRLTREHMSEGERVSGQGSGVEVQLPLVHLPTLELHRHVLNAEQDHGIMNVL
jgi:hypothetical protein